MRFYSLVICIVSASVAFAQDGTTPSPQEVSTTIPAEVVVPDQVKPSIQKPMFLFPSIRYPKGFIYKDAAAKCTCQCCINHQPRNPFRAIFTDRQRTLLQNLKIDKERERLEQQWLEVIAQLRDRPTDRKLLAKLQTIETLRHMLDLRQGKTSRADKTAPLIFIP